MLTYSVCPALGKGTEKKAYLLWGWFAGWASLAAWGLESADSLITHMFGLEDQDQWLCLDFLRACQPQGIGTFYLVAQSIKREQTELHCLFLSSLRSHMHNLHPMLLITSKSQACQYFRRDIAPLLDGCTVKIKTEKSLWGCCCHLWKVKSDMFWSM